MKFRLGACAAVILLAACSGEKSADGVAQLSAKSASGAAATAASVHSGRAVLTSIANAPDRGALMTYQNKGKPSKVEGAFTYYPVAISEDHALKGVVSGHMTVPMPDGTQVKLKYEHHDETIDGNWTWVGKVEGGDPMQEAIITFGEKAVFASIPQSQGRHPISIQTSNGQLFAVQVDPSQLKSGNSHDRTDVAIPSVSSIVEAATAQIAASAQVAQSAPAVAANAPPTSVNTVDVAVGYTPSVRTRYGSASGAVTRIASLVATGNEALRNSKVNGYIRLVHAMEVAYTETNSNQTALQELTGSNGVDPVTIPAALAPLRTARDTYGADVVLLLRKFQEPEHQGCGIAWLIGANQASVTPANDSRWGYGVVSDDNDDGFYCAPESFVHEIGHLLGSQHNQANANNISGRFPYSYGYKTDSNNGNFFTIMAYGDENQIPMLYFSSPLTTCGDRPCGTATADNARSLNQTFPVVAQFRATVVPFNRGLGNDFNGDGRSDVFWRNSQTNANSIWWSASSTNSTPSTTASNWTVVGSGDFNGDGKSDLLWRSTGGGNSIWWSGAVTGATNSTAAMPWKVVGVGDFNGDGKADIFWRNYTTGANSIWWSGSVTGATNSSAATVWQVVGVGDFNGDGRSDVLWRNPVSLNNSIWFSGSVTGARSSNTAGNWSVAGVGDFNGDGKSDIFWRSTGGGNSIWWSGLVTGATNSSLSTAWTLETTGDYDGDGNWDVFWRNRSTGENQIWRSGSASSIQSVPALSGSAWGIYP